METIEKQQNFRPNDPEHKKKTNTLSHYWIGNAVYPRETD